MYRRFRLRHYSSTLALGERIVDALLAPATLVLLMRLEGVHLGERMALLGIVATLLTALSMEAVGLYRRWRGSLLTRELGTIVTGWALVCGGVFFTSVTANALASVPADVFITWLVLAPLSIAGFHALGRLFLRTARAHGYNHRTAVIAGAGELGSALAGRLNGVSWAGINVVGFFDDDAAKQGDVIKGLPVLGGLEQAVPYMREQGIDILYLALPMRAERAIAALMEAAQSAGVAVYMVPNVFAFDLLGAHILDIDGIPVLSLSESPQIGPAGALKRLEDLVLGGAGLLLLAPVFLLVGALIKCTSPGPVFFGHWRVGRNGRPFTCYKFRTMVADADAVLRDLLARDPEARREWEEDHKLRHDPRITRLGRFLRRTSLDELPQLLNVVKGEMSLVGPRPIVESEVGKYGRFFRHLAMVRPGMTGLWQVSGRNDVTYEQRVQLDVEYARSWSVWVDLVILGKTFRAVLARSGSY